MSFYDKISITGSLPGQSNWEKIMGWDERLKLSFHGSKQMMDLKLKHEQQHKKTKLPTLWLKLTFHIKQMFKQKWKRKKLVA